MAIATDIEVNWNGTIDNTNKIGLSKPFTELASDVWADDSAFITAYNNPAAKFTKVSDGYPTCPVKSNDCPWYLTGSIGYSNTNHNSDSIYLRSAIICIPDDFVYNTWNSNQGGRIRDNINNFRIVTSMSTVKNGVDVSLTVRDGTVIGAQYVLKETLTGSSSNGGITIGAGTYVLMIVDIYTVDGNYYLNIPYSLPGFVYDTNNGDGVMGMWAYDSSVNKMFSLSPQIFPTDDGRISITGGATYSVNTWNRHELPAVDGDENLIFCASYIPWNWYLSLSGNVHYHLLAVSRFGLKFKYNNENYKPIITQGVVTGYTTDMTVPSDIDNWTDISGHNISPAPPSPSPSGDDPSDDQAWGGAYSGAGAFSKFYLCTETDLANLRTWFGGGGSGDQIPDGFDPMGQVLGLLQYPVSISGTALAPEEIVFRSGKTIVHTNVNATRSTGGFLHIDCGSVEIPRRMQERGVPFLDFETSLEIYVPFCGTAPLDVQTCVGQTLTCDMYVATATGDVSAVIAAGGHPVAYMSGNMAESLPISSAGYGMYLAACKSTWGNGVSQIMNQLTGGATNTIKNTNQAVLNETLSYTQTGGWGHSELIAESYNNPVIGRTMGSLASAKGAAALSLTTTAVNAIGTGANAYEQYQRVKHASYTSVSGSFTSCAAWNYPFTPYVKITRPHKQIPEGNHGSYKHTAGIPLVETKILSGAPGLTTCVNPDVSGIANATAQEKDIIYRALVNGVIV